MVVMGKSAQLRVFFFVIPTQKMCFSEKLIGVVDVSAIRIDTDLEIVSIDQFSAKFEKELSRSKIVRLNDPDGETKMTLPQLCENNFFQRSV